MKKIKKKNARRDDPAVWMLYFLYWYIYDLSKAFQGAFQVVLVVENSPANAGDERDEGSIPGWERSPTVGNGTNSNPCLGDPMDRGAWQATVQGVAKS